MFQQGAMPAVPAKVVLHLSSVDWDQERCKQCWLCRLQSGEFCDPHHLHNFLCWNSVWGNDSLLESLHINPADGEVRQKFRRLHCFKKWPRYSRLAVGTNFNAVSPIETNSIIVGYECKG